MKRNQKVKHLEDFKERLEEIGNDIILIMNEVEIYVLKDKEWHVFSYFEESSLDRIITLLSRKNDISEILGQFGSQDDL